jgi:hypothetical protein
MIDLDAMGKDPWPTWPVDKNELRDLLGEIDWLRALAAHNIQFAEHHVAEKYDALDEIVRLRAALCRIAHAPHGGVYCADGHEEAVLIARVALEGERKNDAAT